MSHPGPPAVEIELTDAERARLTGVSVESSRVAVRARIVLACAEGASNAQVARQLGIAVATVRRWRGAFAAGGLDTLLDAPRDGRPKAELAMAARSGLSKSTIGRIWRDFDLKPHRTGTFKLSSDPLLVEKVVDVVGLYHHPPERAVVLCVDEKSQIQALDRSQPVLPMMPGMP